MCNSPFSYKSDGTSVRIVTVSSQQDHLVSCVICEHEVTQAYLYNTSHHISTLIKIIIMFTMLAKLTLSVTLRAPGWRTVVPGNT